MAKLTKPRLQIFKNGATTFLHNRKVSFAEVNEGNSVVLAFAHYHKEGAHKPAAVHKCLRGKVTVTSLKLSKEAFHSLMYSYIEWRNEKIKDKIKNK